MTTKQQTEFIQSLDGLPTPEQAAQLLELGQQEGETGAKPDASGAPGAAGAADDPKGKQTNESVASDDPKGGEGENGKAKTPEGGTPDGKPATPNEPDPTKTVILAKDGVHTIGYEKLVEAREAEKAAKAAADAEKARADALAQQLATLQAEAAQRAAAGVAPTAAEAKAAKDAATAAIAEGVDPKVFGDFSDEAIAKGISTLMASEKGNLIAAVKETVKAEVAAALAPIQQRHVAEVGDAHVQAILAKHPDAASIVESKELAAYIAAQPSYIQAAINAVLDGGTTAQVIELFDRFKEATGVKQPADDDPAKKAAGVAAAAAAAIEAAQRQAHVPGSLSDIPGGKPGAGATRDEQWSQMDGPALVDAMLGKPPDQINRFLDRRV